MASATTAGLERGRAETILDEVRSAVERWPEYAQQAEVWPSQREQIRATLRLDIAPRGRRPREPRTRQSGLSGS